MQLHRRDADEDHENVTEIASRWWWLRLQVPGRDSTRGGSDWNVFWKSGMGDVSVLRHAAELSS